MKNIHVLFCLLLTVGTALFSINLIAQSATGKWKGKKTAVVLTYDDALNVHLDKVIPLLDSLKLRGSFYLSGYFPGCRDRIKDWRKAAEVGHELGNHTMFHPCLGDGPGRDWVKGERKMENYSIQRMSEEIKMNNILLSAIDGKTKRTFAYPCGDTRIHDTAYLDMKDFVAARGTKPKSVDIAQIDLSDISCTSIMNQSGTQLINQVKRAITDGDLLVFLFHGVGGEHAINVSEEAHRELVYFLKQHENEILILPMVEIAEHIENYQQVRKSNKQVQKTK
ncbi:MAG: chitooligosaccharide deacetylase [Chitinophagaceae bacterium]|nr:MAG: chitooligosaccharide deacetylase [Chitinophagaceae bacterium]